MIGICISNCYDSPIRENVPYIRTFESSVIEPGHVLVIHLDTNKAYDIYYDYFSGY